MIVSKKAANILYFFIGTEAELIKLLPVLIELHKRNVYFKIIASGQNDIKKSRLLSFFPDNVIALTLSQSNIKQTALGLLIWFIQTFFSGVFRFKSLPKSSTLIIHGDTVSTVMGAILGRLYKMRIVHVESGLRSYNFLHPFPEELDRVIASRFVTIHFAPNEWAAKNLQNKPGEVINTKENTLYDSLQFALAQAGDSPLLNKVKGKKYFVFVLHRQENLFNETLMKSLIDLIIEKSKEMLGICVLHASTKVVFERNGILDKLLNNKNIVLVDRVPYFDFMKVLKSAEFIITDGGSNQEEAYYLGIPCLLLREHTERIEGIDKNVILSKNNFVTIRQFMQTYQTYRCKPIHADTSPSKIIANYLVAQ